MARILIAGCGDVGGALAGRLLVQGHSVWGLRRRVEALPEGIDPLAADLGNPETLTRLPEALDFVFYTAAAPAFEDSAYRLTYVYGPGNLLQALQYQGHAVQRFVFVSSTSVYGQRGGEWVDEASATEPTHFSGRHMLAGEHTVLNGPFPAIAVRFGGIYGPGRGRLIERVRRGGPCTDGPPLYTNRIHRDDCAGALQHLIQLTDPGQVYLGVDDAPAPECEVMDWLAGQLSLPLPLRTSEPGRRSGGKRCSNRRLRRSGYRFVYPDFRSGYGALLGRKG